jgi:hypothetical protein
MFSGVEHFERFSDHIKALPPCERYSQSDLLVDQFRLHASGSLAIYYAPFDSINAKAEVVLVGITGQNRSV